MGNTVDELTEAAQEVHDVLGPGCSESTYHSALERELSDRGVAFSSEGTIPILYKGSPVGQRRPDLFVQAGDGMLVVELKAGSERGESQMVNYVDILGDDDNFQISQGILLQFNDDLSVIKS